LQTLLKVYDDLDDLLAALLRSMLYSRWTSRARGRRLGASKEERRDHEREP
jgi:hypothetical protein